MPCFSPLWHSIRRFMRGLFKRDVESLTPTSEGLQVDGPNMKDSVMAAVESLDTSASKSFVCGFCWDTGLFAPGPFQEAWSALLSYTGYTYTTTWSQLQISGDGGCHWCKLLLSTRTQNMPLETLQVTVGFRPTSNHTVATPKAVQTLRLMLNGTPHSVYYVATDPDDVAASSIVARTRLLNLDSPSTCALASNCITTCIREHERCPPPHSSTLPRRVIDCSTPSKPRLTLSHGEEAPYLVLSYVRGNNELFGTFSHNLDAFLQNIDTTLIPPTIRDAIRTTHAYGVRYLWVDAFCILQDSPEDKARETSELGTILQNAYFTIIAASAQNVTEGFLHDRPPPSPPDILLPFRCPDGQVGSMSLSPVWLQYDGSSEAVNQDAWCLQERLLSPRALVYASPTLQFHCRTSVANVGDAVCGPIVGHRLPETLFRGPTDPEIIPALSQKDIKTLRWAWIETVGEFTQRVVSDPADKLPAIAAVAELFHNSWRSEYLAGLWRDTLLEDLLWYKTPETRYPSPKQYRAPSWSWAAVDGRIMASTTDDRLDSDNADTEHCDIMCCEVIPSTSSFPFGSVVSGTLTLRAVLLKATWDPDSSMPDLFVEFDDTPVQESMTAEAQKPDVSSLIPIGNAYPDCQEPVEDVWAIPIKWNKSTRYAAGLIVTQVGDGQFRRVGYFHSPEDVSEGFGWVSGQDRQDIVLV